MARTFARAGSVVLEARSSGAWALLCALLAALGSCAPADPAPEPVDPCTGDGCTPSTPLVVTGTVTGASSVLVVISEAGTWCDPQPSTCWRFGAVTDGSGRYELQVPGPGLYRLTPSLTGFSFTPGSRLVDAGDSSPIPEDGRFPGQDFTAVPLP